MNFDKWIHLVYIDPKIQIRDSSSKHQAKIKEIWDAIEAKNYDKLISIQPIACPDGKGDYVSYCKYLLHCLDILKNQGGNPIEIKYPEKLIRKDEGSTE